MIRRIYLLGIILHASFAGAEFSGQTGWEPLSVVLERIECADDSSEYLVNVSSQCADTLKAVRIEFHDRSKQLGSMDLGPLYPYRRDVKILYLGHSVGRIYCTIDYVSKGVTNRMAVLDTADIPMMDANMWRAVIPAAIGLISALLAAFCLHWFTRRREIARTTFEWNKMIFDKYEADYRRFISRSSHSTSAVFLRTEFESLRERVVLPTEVAASFEQVIAILQSPSRSEIEKKQSMDNFIAEITRATLSPTM